MSASTILKGFAPKPHVKKSTERNLYDITITEDENRIYLTFYGSGFLYNMVRILTGTLVSDWHGRKNGESIEEVFAKKERALGGCDGTCERAYVGAGSL